MAMKDTLSHSNQISFGLLSRHEYNHLNAFVFIEGKCWESIRNFDVLADIWLIPVQNERIGFDETSKDGFGIKASVYGLKQAVREVHQNMPYASSMEPEEINPKHSSALTTLRILRYNFTKV